jgi:hypothetical protein
VITGYKFTPEVCNFPEIRPLGVTPHIVFMLTCYLPEDIPTKYDSKNRISASFPTTQVCKVGRYRTEDFTFVFVFGYALLGL